MDYVQGHCAAGLRIAAGLIQRPASEVTLWHLQVCASGFNASVLRRHVAWAEAHLARLPAESLPAVAWSSAVAGEAALRLGDWNAAKPYAERGLVAAMAGGHSVYELDNLLVLRAADRGLRDAAAVDRLSTRVLQVAAQVGFDPPERFGGPPGPAASVAGTSRSPCKVTYESWLAKVAAVAFAS